MNFSIYLDDETGRWLTQAAKRVGESRSALVRQAVSSWLNRRGSVIISLILSRCASDVYLYK
jgi:predicted transcriptional regulator